MAPRILEGKVIIKALILFDKREKGYTRSETKQKAEPLEMYKREEEVEEEEQESRGASRR